MILAFITLILLSAFFSGVEIAYFSLTPGQVKLMLEKKYRFAELIWKLKQRPQRLLITVLIGNNVVNVFTAALATVLATDYFGSFGVGIATGLVTIFILVFGEITPKSLAHKKNKLLAQIAAPILYILVLILSPVSWCLIKFNNLIIKKIFKIGDSNIVTEEEIRSMARLGVETGAIDYRERELIENVFQFNDIRVKEIVIPRYKVVTLNGNVPVEQIAHFVSQSGHSRYPVYDKDEDDIVGYIHVNDLMKALNSDDRDKLVKDFVRPLRRVKANRKIESLFRSILKHKEHLVLVVRETDENDILGIVTLEDILEELVGEIEDETDKDDEELSEK